MIKYLWDLNLDEISLGWEETYKEALEENPKGTNIKMEDYDMNGRLTMCKYFYDPVGYRNLIHDTFNKYKIKAKTLFDSKETDDIKTFINKLIKLDIILYNLLANWTNEDDEFDGSCFDPKYLKKESNLLELDFYFDESDFSTDFEKKYRKYKFINL